MPTAAAPSFDEASPRVLTRYPKLLFVLLTVASLFEGFDTMLASLVLPVLAAEFGGAPEPVSCGASRRPPSGKG